MKYFLLILFASLCSLQLSAQNTYTEKLRKNDPNKGTIIINHSSDIDAAVNGTSPKKSGSVTTPINKAPGNDKKQQSDKKQPTEKHEEKHAKGENAHNTSNESKTKEHNAAEHKKVTTTSTSNSNAKNNGQKHYVNRARHKQRGFRICIFTGGNTRADKIKAIEMGQKCRNLFKELAVYPSFEAPRWVTHVGDFKTRQEAQKYVTRIRRARISYEVRIVSSEVNVPY